MFQNTHKAYISEHKKSHLSQVAFYVSIVSMLLAITNESLHHTPQQQLP